MLEGRFKLYRGRSLAVLNTPIRVSLSYRWNLGSILGITLVRQILTGLFLVILYVRDSAVSFLSVEYVMREVGSGWWVRVLHFNGASLFFVCIYAHIGRGLFLGRFRLWKVWSSGIILFFLVIGEAFLGYVLPWGQMSVWGACVITSLLSVLPWVGETVVVWVWGGLVVNRATLGCFLMLHYLLPFVMLGVILFHILFLHERGRTAGGGARDRELKIKFFPYFISKDSLNLYFLGGLLFLCAVFPLLLGDCENFKEANLMRRPVHIQPEWYFLLVYAVLRAVPNKLGGVVAIVGALVWVWALSACRRGEQSSWGKEHKMMLVWLLALAGILTFLGASPVEVPLVEIRQVFTLGYFSILFCIIRLYSLAW